MQGRGFSWHHKQHTPLDSWNSDKNNSDWQVVERRPQRRKHQVQTDLHSHCDWFTELYRSCLFCFSFFYSRKHCLTDHTCVCNFMGHTALIFIRFMAFHSIGSRARGCHEENWHPSIALQQSNNLLDLRIQKITDFFFFFHYIFGSVRNWVQFPKCHINISLGNRLWNVKIMEDNKKWKPYT